jgi:predicted transcriptional regulator
MTKTEAISRIHATLPALSAAQAEALAELATTWARQPDVEDVDTLNAVAEGLAEADRGEYASAAEVDAVLGRPWKT